jgi:hypothetical protein
LNILFCFEKEEEIDVLLNFYLFISAFISFLLPLKSDSRSLLYNNALLSLSLLYLYLFMYLSLLFLLNFVAVETVGYTVTLSF